MREARRWLEAAGWVVLVTVLWGADLLVKIAERNQTGFGKSDFRLMSEQATSAIAVLVMIAFVIRWLQLFPLRRDAWVPAVIGHTAGSVIFAFGHHVLMIAMRVPWYRVSGMTYDWRDGFLPNLIVEYQKDIKVYLGILLIVTAYRFYRRTQPAAPTPPGNRLVVHIGSAERVLRFDEIDYLEAARNYVAVHADGREYLVRDTMANLAARLAGGPFVRSHRSFIVNLDKIAELRSADSRYRIVLTSGAEVPLSRSYRDGFKSLLGG
jgi:hypothetical protein